MTTVTPPCPASGGTPSGSWSRALVGLGANLPFEGGQPEQTLVRAMQALSTSPGIRVLSCSSLWRSRPVMAEGPDFINAALELETELTPEALLALLLTVETSFGRHRLQAPGSRAAARTLDLDLLWMDGATRSLPDLVLPHPRAEVRAFVLAPLAELRPGLRLRSAPEAQTVEALLALALRENPIAVERLEQGCVTAA